VLKNVNFSRALLMDADFTGASLDGCKFSETSLGRAKGFNTLKINWINYNDRNLYGEDARFFLESEVLRMTEENLY
jgi:uncharacterized protein YjbI with pentapeptide repeats